MIRSYEIFNHRFLMFILLSIKRKVLTNDVSLKISINFIIKFKLFLVFLYIDYNKIFENKIKIEFNESKISWIIYLTNILVYFIY